MGFVFSQKTLMRLPGCASVPDTAILAPTPPLEAERTGLEIARVEGIAAIEIEANSNAIVIYAKNLVFLFFIYFI